MKLYRRLAVNNGRRRPHTPRREEIMPDISIDEETHNYLSEIGRKGGLKSGARKPRSHFVMMGKKSAESRKKKKEQGAKGLKI